MSTKNSNVGIGNRTSDLPACGPVPHANEPPRAGPSYTVSRRQPYES